MTLAAGVPTVWMGVLQPWSRRRYDLSPIARIACGGAARPGR